jgi:2'-5' RNA ligase
MLRTFVAVELNHAVQHAAAGLIRQLAGTGADVKWVEEENIHFTLHFLGDVAEEEIPRVIRPLDKAVRPLPAFPVEVQHVGAFPSVHRPRTLWIGAGNGAEPLGVVHDVLRGELSGLGFRTEHRGFVPHATIGRVRSMRHVHELSAALESHEDFQAGESLVNHVTVFSSELRPSGSVYTPLARIPLEG